MPVNAFNALCKSLFWANTPPPPPNFPCSALCIMHQYILVIWSGIASNNIDCAKRSLHFFSIFFFATSDLHLTMNKRCPAEGFREFIVRSFARSPNPWTKMFKCMYLDKYCHTLICIYTLYCNMFPIWAFAYCWHITINAPQCKKTQKKQHHCDCAFYTLPVTGPQRQRTSKPRAQCVIVSVRLAHSH